MMKYLFVLIMAFAINCWSIPKPMESVENYNVMLIHGAYGSNKGFSADPLLPEAYNAGGALENGATLGGYTNDVQGNYYNGDVDKIITLDSPHEGTGALNMLIKKSMREESALRLAMESLHKITCIAEAVE